MTTDAPPNAVPQTAADVPHFPAAVGISHLRVYDTVAPDGATGGSPHLHLASAEAYVVTAGRGRVETLSVASGAADFELVPGAVVWFEPGVIHRLVNGGGLEITVIMQNAGLPEAGDAVLVFPTEIVANRTRYAAAATLPTGSNADRLAAAHRRRDLAVDGFTTLRDAARAGDDGVLRAFLGAAVALRAGSTDNWRDLWRGAALAEALLTGERLDAVGRGETGLLAAGRVHGMTPAGDHPGFGMCGRLDTYLPDGVRTPG